MLVTGPNGAGKTNLLEALHLGTQGFSPRTRSDAQLVRHGAERGRVELSGHRRGSPAGVAVTVALHEPKQATLNGAAVRSAEHLRRELTTLVFTPDRLAVVKAGPAVRRAYLDRVVARLLPARAGVPVEYGSALGQRNAALRAVAAGRSSPDAVAPWTARLAELGAELTRARADAVAALQPSFAARSAELGVDDATLAYDHVPPTVAEIESRYYRDVERGVTSIGPHLHDLSIRSAGRELRSFGSQGEQRITVLALLLAEAELLAEGSGDHPLLLLDDALSELDGERRRRLTERLGAVGQTMVTATGPEALPLSPAQLVVVSPGSARVA